MTAPESTACVLRGSLTFFGTLAALVAASTAAAILSTAVPKAGSGAAKVSDIRTTSPNSLVSDPVVVNGTLYFVADDGVSGSELWRSDGSETGTTRVKDIRPGPASSLAPNTARLTPVGDRLYMAAIDELGLSTLWVSDGTEAGTVRLGSSNPESLVGVGDALYFSGEFEGKEPWRSDGTAAGTRLIKDVAPYSDITGSHFVISWFSSGPRAFTGLNGVVYFSASSHGKGRELWRTDGTEAGTTEVKDILPGEYGSDPASLVEVGGTLFFTANDGTSGVELWKSDGSAAGTVRVKDINPGAGGSGPTGLVAHAGALYFTASDGVNGAELWKSDGTDAGTLMVKDINPGATGSSPARLASLNGALYFVADDGSGGAELWTSDGTAAGTTRVKDIMVGSAGSSPTRLTAFNGQVYFIADDGAGAALWRSDGTDAGTVKAVATLPALGFPDAGPLTVLGGALHFAAADPRGGTELWRSDGTAAGTRMVRDVNPGIGSRGLGNLAAVGDTMFFSADDGVHGVELWKSDGTSTGTVMVKDLRAIIPLADANPNNLVVFNGKLVFASDSDTSGGTELFTSDGTAAGTVKLKEINAANFTSQDQSGSPMAFARMNGALFFSAHQENYQYTHTELWKTDGTEPGTAMVRDIAGGSYQFRFLFEGSHPRELTAANGALFFSASEAAGGRELWRSDGTAAGTLCVKDIVPGAVGSNPRALTNVGGTLFFVADDGASGAELWKSDGTDAGTVRVKDIRPGGASSGPASLVNLNGTLLFAADDGVGGVELWKSDGTDAGTVLVKDINPAGSSDPRELVVVGGAAYFSATDGTGGRELWKSDGTQAGTVRVKDIAPGAAGSRPEALTRIYGTLYFTADDGASGVELWKSDGTDAGTVMVEDVNPGPGSSWPRDIAVAGAKVFFTAYDGTAGRGLWVAPADVGTGGAPVDIALTMAAAPGAVVEGENVTFTLAAKNYGAAPTRVDIGAAIPAGATFVSASPACIAGAGRVDCTANAVAAGATFVVTVVLRRATPGELAFTALASSPAFDVLAADNEAAVAVKVQPASVKLPRLVNLSTRARVLTGDDVLIGGFVIGGTTNKTIVVRARSTSMPILVLSGLLQNARLELYSGQTVIASNDDWRTASNALQVMNAGLEPPTHDEATILATLAPGPYTAIVSGVGNGTGLALMEVFEVDHPEVPLLNIATRGKVGTGNDVMIAGFVIQGDGPQSVVVRARGPTLAATGVPNVLQNPHLQLVRSSDNAQIAVNDNWVNAANAFAIQASGFAPADALESAILVTLDPGAYTAIVTGVGATTGVAIVEVFRN
jgi:uncharacterized repeat protein (TIGR01451 family)